jgi:lysophospholipase L1-like esterase
MRIPLPRSPLRELAALAVVGAVTLAWQCARLAFHYRVGDRIARDAIAFECCGSDCGPRVLVVGDSTGVGTGATRPEDSLAGLLARDHPQATVVNRARNGARTSDAIRQLQAEQAWRFDLILIHVGGNDILKRTPIAVLPALVDTLLGIARQMSDHVVVTTTPNVGLVPAFQPPLSWWLTRRSRQVRDIFARTAGRHGAHYVNFFHPRSVCPFSRESRRYFARDGIHPTTDCYALVYATLRAASPIRKALGPEELQDEPGPIAGCVPELLAARATDLAAIRAA